MSLVISRILHAGYLFSKDQYQIAFDPILQNPFSTNCYAFPEVQFNKEKIRETSLNAVFISHIHDDHFCVKSLSLLNKNTQIFIYCLDEEVIQIIKQLGFKYVTQLGINEKIKIGPFQITTRKSLEPEMDSLFQIEVDGLNILNVVDSWIDDSTMNQLVFLKPWDLILWPFQTMRELEVIAPDRFKNQAPEWPQEWVDQLIRLEPHSIIPSSCQFRMESWSWYNKVYFPISYKFFEELVGRELPDIQIQKLNPSQSIQWINQRWCEAQPLSWLKIVGNENEDYEFDETTIPQSTAEISNQFPALLPQQKKRVLEFCETELSKRIDQLPVLSDPYFKTDRYWKLQLWDCNSELSEYCYLVNYQQVKRVSLTDVDYSWMTELPLQKLFLALENGESLTSIYIRITNSKFDDLFDDPLIRAVFSGKIASFQKAQLNNLTENLTSSV